MEKPSYCTANGNQCTACVGIANDEFTLELRGAGFDEATTLNYVEDAKLRAQIEDQGGLDVLTVCDDRQNRARIIGRRAGEALVDRSKGPGDA
jgi:hypothetical protein